MKKDNSKKDITLPAGARRVTHPRLGIRVWLINGKYYRTRADYLYPPLVIDSEKNVSLQDNSLPA